jgi:phosphatidylglycerol:prolipoprotein diacylglycerol transferase
MIPFFQLDRYLPSVGSVGIHAFGILVATGILVGARLTRGRGRQLGLEDEQVAQMITWTLVGGFSFAHVFDVFAYQTAGSTPTLWQILNPFGGLSSYGGFIGALGGLFVWAKRHKQPVMPYADSLGFGLAAGWLFGRLGCFTAHDHPGRFTDFFLSVRYPDGVRHDLGLDEALWALAMTTLFLVLRRRKRPLGLYVSLLTLAYAPFRFLLDFLRATDVAGADPRYFGLTPAQYGSVAVAVAGVSLIIWTTRRAALQTERPGCRPG